MLNGILVLLVLCVVSFLVFKLLDKIVRLRQNKKMISILIILICFGLACVIDRFMTKPHLAPEPTKVYNFGDYERDSDRVIFKTEERKKR